MIEAARIAAAIEVLDDIAARRRPAADALKDWGLAHRFAGSKDRAAIASFVYDALRRRASAAFVMSDHGGGTASATAEEGGATGGRAVMLGMLRLERGLDPGAIDALFSGERHAPAPLSPAERRHLADSGTTLARAPLDVAGDFPAWITPSLARVFGDDVLDEMQALAGRAPLDIRANTLKTDRDSLAAELDHLGFAPMAHAPDGLRLAPPRDGRGPSLHGEEAFVMGRFEVQDEGSQIAGRLTAPEPGSLVVDLCAGAGGKTLELAALMRDEGRLIATDVDGRRLVPLHQRLERSGASIVEVRMPKGRWRPDGPEPLADIAGKADLVVVDAPCTGTGTWRRNPDAKWRLRPGSLAERVRDQQTVLARAAGLVRPGGRIAYITCSVLAEENDDAIASFLAGGGGFARAETPVPVGTPVRRTAGGGIMLTPARSGTDGFYVATLARRA